MEFFKKDKSFKKQLAPLEDKKVKTKVSYEIKVKKVPKKKKKSINTINDIETLYAFRDTKSLK